MGKKEYIRIVQEQFPGNATVAAYAQKVMDIIYKDSE